MNSETGVCRHFYMLVIIVLYGVENQRGQFVSMWMWDVRDIDTHRGYTKTCTMDYVDLCLCGNIKELSSLFLLA